MKQHTKITRVIALLLVMLLVMAMAACGDDDNTSTATTASGSSATTPTQAAAAATTAAPTATVMTAQPSPTTAQATATTAAPATATTAAPTATSAPASPTTVPLTGDLTVFAAASLTDAFNTMKAQLEAASPGLKITFNFAGSQALVTQMTQGAQADVFASANNTQMKAAQDGGVIDGTPVTFARNRLAIIVPKDNPAGITGLADLAKPGIKLVVADKTVPAGQYFLQVLDNAAKDPAFGADFPAKVTANIVSLETNVKDVVSKVQLGEADAGVVYFTDVTPAVAKDVTLIDIPDPYNVIAVYPIATVKGGNTELAQAFIDYVMSPAGQAILKQSGFIPPQ